MAFEAGRVGSFKFDSSADVLTDYSAYVDDMSFKQLAKLLETTAFGKSFVTRIGGLKDGSCSIGGPHDVVIDLVMNAALGTTKSDEIGPAGVATGDPKYSGEAFISDYQLKTAVDGRVDWSAEFATSD